MKEELGKIIETGSRLHVVIRFVKNMHLHDQVRVMDAYENLFEEMNENDKGVMRLTFPLLKVQRIAVLMAAMMETGDLIEGFELELL